MRARTILMGAALGAAAYYLKQHPEARAQLKAQSQDLGRKLRERAGPMRQQLQEKADQIKAQAQQKAEQARSQAQAPAEEKREPHLHGAHKSTTDQNHEDLEHMVDDVAHRPDIPDTEMKHAFEEAVEEHHRI